MKALTLFGVSILLLFFPSLLRAESDSSLTQMSTFIQNINMFNAVLPQEKVYLHFDNTSYYLGEHLWFKAYVVKTSDNLPTGVSKVLHVELLNQQGFVLQTRKLKIENGQCHGDFALTDSMFAGFYEVRAYTRYQLNFDQDNGWKCQCIYSSTLVSGWYNSGFIWTPFDWAKLQSNRKNLAYHNSEELFSRVFPVYDNPSKAGDYQNKQMRIRAWAPTLSIDFNKRGLHEAPNIKTEIPKPAPVVLTFFPEGGNLIQGVASRVAFKSTGGEGQDIQVSGQLWDQNGNVVTTFKTAQRGMGVFDFCPTDTTTYSAHVRYQSNDYSFTLPTCERSGYVLRVNNLTDEQFLRVQVNRAINMEEELVGLSVLCQGAVVWFDTIRMKGNAPVNIPIDKSLLHSGVGQLTLFNSNGQIYADRLLFTSHVNDRLVRLETSQLEQSNKPFEPVSICFKATNELNIPIKTNFSLSVRDAATTESTYYTDNIVTNLLLSSELKGYIADPGYYFQSNDLNHRTALDLLMMIQGWRKYTWKEMAGVETFRITEPAEKGLALDGCITRFIRGKGAYQSVPDANVKLFVSLSDSLFITGEENAAKDGNFRFYLPDFQGKHPAILEMKDCTIIENEIDEQVTKKKSLIIRLLDRLKVKENLSERDFSQGMLAIINRIQLVPKSTYSYYETTIPETDWNDDKDYASTGSMAKGFTLNGVEVKAKKRDPFRYKKPNLTKPDFILTGEDLFEAIMDNYWIIRSGLLEMLNETIIHKYHLMVDGWDVFYKLGIETFRLTNFNPPILDAGNIEFFLGSGPRVPFEYSFTSAYVLARKKYCGTRPPLENTRRTQIEGYSYLSDFYHPNYSQGVPPDTKDYRRTLYWNPDVQTDSTGSATVQFYNNASCQKLDISAEGITGQGVPFVYKKQ